MLQNVYISLPYILSGRTAGIDRNDRHYQPIVLTVEVRRCFLLIFFRRHRVFWVLLASIRACRSLSFSLCLRLCVRACVCVCVCVWVVTGNCFAVMPGRAAGVSKSRDHPRRVVPPPRLPFYPHSRYKFPATRQPELLTSALCAWYPAMRSWKSTPW